MALPEDLLEILACPFCKSGIRLEGEKIRCTNAECGLIYSIQDDIPIMLIDEAERPCPGCGTQRDWKDDELKCPRCGKTLRYERG